MNAGAFAVVETSLPAGDVPVEDRAHVARAARVGRRVAAEAGFDANTIADLELVVSELATNLVVHAGGGMVSFHVVERHEGDATLVALRVTALDRGVGMADVERCAQDGMSTGGTLGVGLGAIRRLSSSVDIHSVPGTGTVVTAVRWRGSHPPPQPVPPVRFGGFTRPLHGERACGDAWAGATWAGGAAVLLVDGLGHGADAARAAAEIVGSFSDDPTSTVEGVIARAGERARGTRGAAVAIARIDTARDELSFLGVGNIYASVHRSGGSRALASQPGIVGGPMRGLVPQRAEFGPGAVLLLGTDGVHGARWSPAAHPGVFGRDPTVTAAIVVRDFSRGVDDAGVVMARRAP